MPVLFGPGSSPLLLTGRTSEGRIGPCFLFVGVSRVCCVCSVAESGRCISKGKRRGFGEKKNKRGRKDDVPPAIRSTTLIWIVVRPTCFARFGVVVVVRYRNNGGGGSLALLAPSPSPVHVQECCSTLPVPVLPCSSPSESEAEPHPRPHLDPE
jgi:hypothetical protein